MRQYVKEQGLPTHGATFPLALAKFLVNFLTDPGQLEVDLFAGWFTTPMAAEETGRRWIATEKMLQYIEGTRHRFKDCHGYSASHRLTSPGTRHQVEDAWSADLQSHGVTHWIGLIATYSQHSRGKGGWDRSVDPENQK